MLKNGCINKKDWLVIIFNRCREIGAVREEWKLSRIGPVYEVRLDRSESVH